MSIMANAATRRACSSTRRASTRRASCSLARWAAFFFARLDVSLWVFWGLLIHFCFLLTSVLPLVLVMLKPFLVRRFLRGKAAGHVERCSRVFVKVKVSECCCSKLEWRGCGCECVRNIYGWLALFTCWIAWWFNSLMAEVNHHLAHWSTLALCHPGYPASEQAEGQHSLEHL